MKRTLLFLIFLFIVLFRTTQTTTQINMDLWKANSPVHIIEIDRGLWLVEDHLPAYISPELLIAIYDLMEQYVTPVFPNSIYDQHDTSVAVIRFIPEGQAGVFPDTTEGYAGMCDRVEWQCMIAPSTTDQLMKYCTFSLLTKKSNPDNIIRYALIQLPIDVDKNTIQETLGFTVHELSHLVGAVDGIRCPYNQHYNPCIKLMPDTGDSYWWFGVQGVFGLQPDGIVLLALNDRCAESDDLTICMQLKAIFDRYVDREYLTIGEHQ